MRIILNKHHISDVYSILLAVVFSGFVLRVNRLKSLVIKIQHKHVRYKTYLFFI